MAIAEYEEYRKRHCINATSAGLSARSQNGSDNGHRNRRTPIPSTDYFHGELPRGMDLSTLVGQTALASIGERVTSVDGTNSLDPISWATVMQRGRSLTTVPCRDAREGSASNEVPSAASADKADVRGCSGGPNISLSKDANRMLMSVVTLSPDSSGVPHPEKSGEPETVPNNHFSDNGMIAVMVKRHASLATETFPETCLVHGNNHESSGYQIHDNTVSQPRSCSAPRSVNSPSTCLDNMTFNTNAYDEMMTTNTRQTTTPVKYPPLKLSETGINALKCTSGTQSVPLHPKYASLPARLQSYPQGFVLGDGPGVSVNRDLLAFAGFFYSGCKTVTCFHCGCSPRVWGDGRDPQIEHRMLSPYCKILAVPVLGCESFTPNWQTE